MKKKINFEKVKQYLPITFMGVCALGFLIFILLNEDFSFKDALDGILKLTSEYPLITSLIIIGAFVIKGFVVFLPYAVIAIAAMFFLDSPFDIIVVIIGTIVNISIPYWTGRLTKDDWIQKILDKFPKARPYYEMTDNLFLLSFTLRAMNLSNEALGLLFGSAGLKYLPYMVANLVAIAPSAISYMIIGDEFNPIEAIKYIIGGGAGSEEQFWKLIIFVSAIVIDLIMVVVMTTYFRRKKKKQELQKEKSELI